MALLTASGLCKAFGSHRVLRELSFEVEAGTVFGFIGQNGAGKTTTMKIILGLLPADRGVVLMDGLQLRYGGSGAAQTAGSLGYLPDVPSFYGYMKPLEYLQFCGRISGMDRVALKKRCGQLLDMVGLADSDRRISGFSRGMKQRLGIAQALLSRPKLLIADEPTSALDPAGRKEILDILQNIRRETTVLFSTHILSDVERICDQVALLHQGKIAFSGPLEDVKKLHRQDLLVVEFDDPAACRRLLELWSGPAAKAHSLAASESGPCAALSPDGRTLTIRAQNIRRAEKDLLELLAREHLLPTKLEIPEPTLETLFLEVTR